MSLTFEELKKKTVAELREIAKKTEHEATKGYTQLKKDKLIDALCEALGIEKCKKKAGGATGGKSCIKTEIKELKEKRDQAVEARDRGQLRQIRRKLHKLKRASRRAAA